MKSPVRAYGGVCGASSGNGARTMATEPVMNVTYLQSRGVSSEQRPCARQKGAVVKKRRLEFWLRRLGSAGTGHHGVGPVGVQGPVPVLVTLSLLRERMRQFVKGKAADERNLDSGNVWRSTTKKNGDDLGA